MRIYLYINIFERVYIHICVYKHVYIYISCTHCIISTCCISHILYLYPLKTGTALPSEIDGETGFSAAEAAKPLIEIH